MLLKKLVVLGLIFQFCFTEVFLNPFEVEKLYILAKETANDKLQSQVICKSGANEKFNICRNAFWFINNNTEDYREDKRLFLHFDSFNKEEPECEVKTIHFRAVQHLYQQYVQIMMPCFGVHRIIRTDIYHDDYRNEILISAGLKKGFIFIYKHMKMADPRSDYYVLLYHVRLDMKNKNLHFQESTRDPLSSDESPSTGRAINRDEDEVELIYLREMVFAPSTNSDRDVAPTENPHTATTQNAIRPTFQNHVMPPDSDEIEEPLSEMVTIIFAHPNYKQFSIKHLVYRVHGNSMTNYRVSSGPRNRSIVIYKWYKRSERQFGSSGYRPIILVENS